MAESIVYSKWSIPRPLIYSEYELSNLIPENSKDLCHLLKKSRANYEIKMTNKKIGETLDISRPSPIAVNYLMDFFLMVCYPKYVQVRLHSIPYAKRINCS